MSSTNPKEDEGPLKEAEPLVSISSTKKDNNKDEVGHPSSDAPSEEGATNAAARMAKRDSNATSYRRLSSAQSSGMESSVFKFRNVNFVVGSGDKQKNILTDVSGKVKWGREYLSICHSVGFGCACILSSNAFAALT